MLVLDVISDVLVVLATPRTPFATFKACPRHSDCVKVAPGVPNSVVAFLGACFGQSNQIN